jgi:ABC-2 type transport system permease protein
MRIKHIEWRNSARIIWAITAKDLKEVLRNKNTLSVLLSALFIVVMYRMLPVLIRGLEPTNVLIYDVGDSVLLAYLENSQAVEAWTGYETEEQMKRKLGDGDVPELGLVIPADFDQLLETGGDATLQGYILYWVGDEEAAALVKEVEDEIARQLGRRVPINTNGNAVFMQPDSRGIGMQAAAAAVFLLTMIGLSLVSNLMLVEKNNRTLDVLLVSPASEWQIVLSKALTGLFYCLLGGGVALAINHEIVVHWWLAIPGLVCFSLFAVSLGLLLGMKIDNRGQLTLWAWVLILPLFLPVMFVMAEELFPDIVIQISQLIPTSVFFNFLRYTFADPISIGTPLLAVALILIWAIFGLAAVIWAVRRRDRGATAAPGALRKIKSRISPGQLFEPFLAGFSRMRQPKIPAPEPPPPTESDLGSFKTNERSPYEGLRIIRAIAAKDMLEALKNKIILSIMLGSALVIVNGALLPMLLERGTKPSAVIFDQGRSTIIRELSGDEDFRLVIVETGDEMAEFITEGPGTWIGLAIPADFDQRAGGSQPIELEGYVAHWADQSKISQWITFFEQQLGLATWGTVSIDLDGNFLYPPADAGGQISINLTTLIIAVIAIGVALVPMLLVEEKETHTLEAVLVSPARLNQVIIGKALVGFIYCLIAAAVVIFFNRHRIVHWDIVLLASLLTAAFAVALGILVGVLSENPTSAAFWGGPLIGVLLAPTIVQFFINENWSSSIKALIAWMPGSLMLDLYRFSAAGEYPIVPLLSSAAALGVMAGILFLLAGWRIQRLSQ